MAAHLSFTVDGVPIRLYAQEPSGQSKQPAIVLLHGSGGNLDFWTSRLAPLLADAGIALYAPHYFDRTGTGRADLATVRDGVHTAHWLATVDAAIRFVAERRGVDPERIVLAGVSLGAFLALACAAERSVASSAPGNPPLRAVISVSGGLVEPFLTHATERFPPTLILHGEDDTIVSAGYARALSAKLTARNVAHRTEILPGEGHWFSAAALPRILGAVSGFLREHLQETAIPRAM